VRQFKSQYPVWNRPISGENIYVFCNTFVKSHRQQQQQLKRQAKQRTTLYNTHTMLFVNLLYLTKFAILCWSRPGYTPAPNIVLNNQEYLDRVDKLVLY
jgi:hypothetical protein